MITTSRATDKKLIAVAGASGKLGSLVVEALLSRVAARRILALVRTPDKAGAFAARGVEVRHADYSRPDTLGPALKGVQRLLLISGTEVGQRVAQHRAVIEAAGKACVEQIVYTSLLHADRSTLPIAGEHKATEELLRQSGTPFTILRNGWYVENYTERLGMNLARGAFVGAAQHGRVAAAAREDYAAAAVTVLTGEGQDGRTYELAGDSAFTMDDLAAAVSDWAGRPLPYHDLPPLEYEKALTAAGLPEPMIDFLVATDVAIAHGDVDSKSRDLHNLIGRDTRTLREVLATLPKPVSANHPR